MENVSEYNFKQDIIGEEISNNNILNEEINTDSTLKPKMNTYNLVSIIDSNQLIKIAEILNRKNSNKPWG